MTQAPSTRLRPPKPADHRARLPCATTEAGLQEPVLDEGEDRAVADDQVIEDPDVDELERIQEPAGDELVRAARLGEPRGVIVEVMHP